MSFSYKLWTLRGGNSYNSRTQPKMSPHEEEATRKVQRGAIEDNEENSVRFSPHLVAERIKASPETLHPLIFNLTEMMALRWSPLDSRQRHHLPPWDTWLILIYSNQRCSVEYTCWLKKHVALMAASKVFDATKKIQTTC